MSADVMLYRHAEAEETGSAVEIVIPADHPDQVECLVYSGRDECVGVFLGSPEIWRAACLRMADALTALT